MKQSPNLLWFGRFCVCDSVVSWPKSDQLAAGWAPQNQLAAADLNCQQQQQYKQHPQMSPLNQPILTSERARIRPNATISFLVHLGSGLMLLFIEPALRLVPRELHQRPNQSAQSIIKEESRNWIQLFVCIESSLGLRYKYTATDTCTEWLSGV